MTVAVNLQDGNTFPHSISNIRGGKVDTDKSDAISEIKRIELMGWLVEPGQERRVGDIWLF